MEVGKTNPARVNETQRVREEGEVEIKRSENIKPAPETVKRHFAVIENLEEGRKLRESLARVNREISELRMERTRFELDLEEIRATLIEKGRGADGEMIAKMHELKQEIVNNDIERVKKATEITYRLATGSYSVSSDELVKKWFKEQ